MWIATWSVKQKQKIQNALIVSYIVMHDEFSLLIDERLLKYTKNHSKGKLKS